MPKLSGLPRTNNAKLTHYFPFFNVDSGDDELTLLSVIQGLFLTKRKVDDVSSAAPTPDWDTTDLYVLSALGENATFASPTGTPSDGQTMLVRIKDDGTARSLSFNAAYRGIGVTLPTTTTAGKVIYLGLVYNAQDATVDVLAVGRQS